jgi:zinc protease
VFTGSFDVATITPLVQKYLGSLPSGSGNESWKDVSPSFPEGVNETTVRKGTEPQASVAILMDNKFEYMPINRLKMGLLMKILNIRMRESMREDQGGVYGVRSRPSMSKYPKEEINILVSWGCAPENVEILSQTVFAEMDTLKTDGPNQVNLGKAKETTIRDLESNFEKNSYWQGKIKNAFYYNEKLMGLDEIKSVVKAVSASELKEMANTYFKEDHYLKVVLLPELDNTD